MTLRNVMIGTIFAVMVGAVPMGCRRSDDTDQRQDLKIAVIPKATNHEYWKSIHAGAIKAERELPGVQIIWKGATREDDREQQINVVDNFINAGVSGIVLAPLDEKALIKPVAEAMQAGIPVVILDSGLDAEPGEAYVSYVATDNYAGGQKAARHMGALLNRKGNVIVLPYMVGSDSTMQREKGFTDTLKREFPDITLLSADQYTGPTTETAYAKTENVLSRFPAVDGVFGACEPVVFGALLALRNAGRAGTVKLVGFDTSPKLVQALRNGEVHGLVLQDPVKMSYLAVRTVVDHLRGKQVPARIDTGSEVATPANRTEPRIAELLAPPFDQYLP